ncbi:MAG: four helix bundle protein [Fimbriimonadales bacterium]
MSYRNYRELDVWKVSIELVKVTYGVISELPDEEKYALGQQLRRCAVSIPSNIAEGQGRGSAQEIRQFSRMALGSLSELDTQLYLCKDLYGIDTRGTDELIERISRMLSKLIPSVREENAIYATTQ